MAVAIGCHLGLLLALLGPAAPGAVMTPVREGDELALKLRFVSSPRITSMPSASPARHAPAKERTSPSVKRITRVALPTQDADAISASPPPVVASAPVTIGDEVNPPFIAGDGGFRDRMFNAQHSQGIHGVPGSDRRVAPGIELANPMDQGIGSVVRGAQRLFGVTNRHCIDVDVWLHMSPDELKDRHLTVADVEKESETYHCNRPLGLNF